MIKVAIRDITSKGVDLSQIIPKEGIGLIALYQTARDPAEVAAHERMLMVDLGTQDLPNQPGRSVSGADRGVPHIERERQNGAGR